MTVIPNDVGVISPHGAPGLLWGFETGRPQPLAHTAAGVAINQLLCKPLGFRVIRLKGKSGNPAQPSRRAVAGSPQDRAVRAGRLESDKMRHERVCD